MWVDRSVLQLPVGWKKVQEKWKPAQQPTTSSFMRVTATRISFFQLASGVESWGYHVCKVYRRRSILLVLFVYIWWYLSEASINHALQKDIYYYTLRWLSTSSQSESRVMKNKKGLNPHDPKQHYIKEWLYYVQMHALRNSKKEWWTNLLFNYTGRGFSSYQA
jgi:hypothetical protein